jgi:ribosomal protein S15P/S13E
MSNIESERLDRIEQHLKQIKKDSENRAQMISKR